MGYMVTWVGTDADAGPGTLGDSALSCMAQRCGVPGVAEDED